MTTIVIGCGSRKASTAQLAADLYTGTLFRLARAAAEADGRPWMILSARHGLIAPTQILEPYNETLTSRADVADLARLIEDQADPGPVEVWAARRYIEALEMAGRTVAATPMAGLGIGQRMAWLSDHRRSQ